ncbi:MAG TPA: chemotaxis protein CheW [Blastocatellia bacterium]|nr:chemotaxis protein CheW [Blastocatellia bacterium]
MAEVDNQESGVAETRNPPISGGARDAASSPIDAAESPSFLVFSLGGCDYGIGVETTEGVVDCPSLCPLPDPPDGVIGVGSIKGRMTIVVDLSRGLSQWCGKRRLVLLKGDARLGLLADRVYGVTASDQRTFKGAAESNSFGWPVTAWFEHNDKVIPVLDVDHLIEE